MTVTNIALSVEGAVEHTFVTERAVLGDSAGGEIAGAGAQTAGVTAPSTVDDAVLFIGRLSGGGRPLVPLPDFADALQTQRVLQAAVESARQHAPVTVTGASR